MTGSEWVGRIVPAIAINGVLAWAAWRTKGVRTSGVWGGLAVGVPIYLGLGWPGFSVLVAMYVIGTALTRFGYARKERLGVAEGRKGARGGSHALANAGVAALYALLALVEGTPEFRIGFVAALATAAMDTAGSEVGPLWARRTISLRTLRPVPPGTEGAVSLEGTAAGFGVALLLGLLGWRVGLHPVGAAAVVAVGAAVGNLYEGLLGSRKLLSHAWLNASSTAVGALAAVFLADLLVR
jgi:uncharacterized protein (TIGR00297 family)